MSLYISGVELPKDNKAIHLEIHGDGTVIEWKCGESDRVVSTAIPVPPHGRLIDADVLQAKQQEDADMFIDSNSLEDADPFVDSYSLTDKIRRDEALNAVANIVNAPTIIPASEDGET